MSGPPKKRMHYDAEFKLKVVELAFQTANMNVACHYSKNKKQVREWRKAENVLKEMPKKSKRNLKILPKWPKIEKNVAKWVGEKGQKRPVCYTCTDLPFCN